MFHKKIESKYSTAKISCCNERCNIRISDQKNSVMLKGELLSSGEKMCDCIVFRNDKKIVLIELKSSSLNVGKIIEKFENSGKRSLSIATSIESKSKFTLFFVLLAKNYSNYSAHDRLRRSRLRINGGRYMIQLGRCGSSLKDYVA